MRRLALLSCVLLSGLAAAQPPAHRSYSVDAGASDIHWLVYKAGTLARLGHNHVVSVGELSGSVTVDGANPAESTFEIEFPVAGLVIDDPVLRSGLGADFASVPTENDVAGTRNNMLGDRVLDGGRFPSIRLTGTGPSGTRGNETLQVKITLLGRSVDLTVPTQISIDESSVVASGEFELTHADLGMQPFSVMMGALQVAEGMRFSYRIEARAVQQTH